MFSKLVSNPVLMFHIFVHVLCVEYKMSGTVCWIHCSLSVDYGLAIINGEVILTKADSSDDRQARIILLSKFRQTGVHCIDIDPIPLLFNVALVDSPYVRRWSQGRGRQPRVCAGDQRHRRCIEAPFFGPRWPGKPFPFSYGLLLMHVRCVRFISSTPSR